MTRLRREVILVYIGGVALAASAFLACGVLGSLGLILRSA